MMTELNLYDVWRDENNDKQLFTWKRKLGPGKLQMGRLDFFSWCQNLSLTILN